MSWGSESSGNTNQHLVYEYHPGARNET
jgi:hypothetical protein